MLDIHSFRKLSNGVKIPLFGLGVYQIPDDSKLQHAIEAAFDAGYRKIDTAAMYRNEPGVGKAIRNSTLTREEVFVTSKVWNSDQGYDETLRAFEKTRKNLGFDPDLYLIHWPVKGKFKATWKALEELYDQGHLTSIGVSNFHRHHLEDLMSNARIAPMVNQIELHPRLQQSDLVTFCQQHEIHVEAWSPLMRGEIFQVDELAQLAEKHGKSIAQIALRWCLQRGLGIIPKSDNPDHVRANAAIFDFELDDQDMAGIGRLDRHQRIGPDPDNFDF